MKKLYFKRLIRDGVLKKLQTKGLTYHGKILKGKEYERELLNKIPEEAGALNKVKTRQEFMSELADLLEVIDEALKMKKIKPSELKKARQENRAKKGGFKKKFYLDWTNDDGYKTNETPGGK